MDNQQTLEAMSFLASLKHGIWLLCIPAWLFGMLERGVTAFSHHAITPGDFFQILTATFFLVGWLLLKPKSSNKPIA
jgi:hypothetical protein